MSERAEPGKRDHAVSVVIRETASVVRTFGETLDRWSREADDQEAFEHAQLYTYVKLALIEGHGKLIEAADLLLNGEPPVEIVGDVRPDGPETEHGGLIGQQPY